MDCYDDHHDPNTAERYYYQMNEWSMIAPRNDKRFEGSATALNSKIYFTGGFNGKVQLNSLEVGDPEINQWNLAEKILFEIVAFPVSLGYVYTTGRSNCISWLCSVKKLNPKKRMAAGSWYV
jgi:hypothetical protein